MYTIPLKSNSKEIDLVVIRSLFALAGITAFFFRTGDHPVINTVIAVILLTAAFAVRYLIYAARLKKVQLLIAGGLLLFAATYAITFPLLLFTIGMLSSFIYKKPAVLLNKKEVTVKSSKGSTTYSWDDFENIVLKDNLLTLDYKNNKLLQLDTDFQDKSVDEKSINSFCEGCLKTADNEKAT